MIHIFWQPLSPRVSACTINVSTYYKKNWHPIRSEWVEGLKQQQLNLCESTNNRIESFFGKLKAHIDHHSSIKQLVEGFLTAVGTMRDERMAKMTKRLTKVSILPHAFEVLLDYEEVVTPYAVDYISSQLEYSLKVKVLDSGSVESSSGILGVSENNCDCNSFQSMGLPCRHILAICKYNNRSQFLSEIIHQR